MEPQIVATIGMAITTIGLSFFIFLGTDTPLWLIMRLPYDPRSWLCILLLAEYQRYHEFGNKKHLGIASGMVATMRSLGQVLSMAIAMFCFSIFIGAADITPAVYPALIESTVVAFLIFTMLCILGVAASYVRGSIHATVSPKRCSRRWENRNHGMHNKNRTR